MEGFRRASHILSVTHVFVHYLTRISALAPGAIFPQPSCVHIRQCTHSCVTNITYGTTTHMLQNICSGTTGKNYGA